MKDYKKHCPVMSEELIGYLKKAGDRSDSHLFADLTFGAGGHSLLILQEIKKSFLVAFDQDPEACLNGISLLENSFAKRFIFHHSNFEHFSRLTENLPDKFAGIIADLGVSSHQLGSLERGFSFKKDAPLDMRMDKDNPCVQSAAALLEEWSEEKIAQILYTYGEERFAKRIARLIVEHVSERVKLAPPVLWRIWSFTPIPQS